MDIYKYLPYKWHHWLILHFGKPKIGYSPDQFKYYELHGWIACPYGQIIHTNMWETYQRWKQEIAEAIERVCK